MSSFKLALGPKQMHDTPLRPNDFNHEILVNFEDGQERGLGWLTVIKDPLSGQTLWWAVITYDGESLPGMMYHRFKTKKAAVEAAAEWLADYLASEGGAQ